MAIMGRVTSADMESMIADITTVSITAADIDYHLKECSSIIKYVMMGPHSFCIKKKVLLIGFLFAL